jgi:hypothetical protein
MSLKKLGEREAVELVLSILKETEKPVTTREIKRKPKYAGSPVQTRRRYF